MKSPPAGLGGTTEVYTLMRLQRPPQPCLSHLQPWGYDEVSDLRALPSVVSCLARSPSLGRSSSAAFYRPEFVGQKARESHPRSPG